MFPGLSSGMTSAQCTTSPITSKRYTFDSLMPQTSPLSLTAMSVIVGS